MSGKPTYEALEKQVEALKETQEALKKTAAALRDCEEKYRRTFESITDSITITRIKDGLYLFVNDGFCRQTGYSRKEVLGRTPFHINLYPYPSEREQFIQILKNQGKAENIVVSFRRKNGEIYYSEFSAKPISYAGENCLLAQSRDITDRKRAEEALQERETFLQTLMDAIPAPVFYKDKYGKYLGFNKAFEVFFGKTKDWLIGKSVFDINPPELAEIYKAKDEALLKEGGIQRYESQWKNVHGGLTDFIFNKALFKDKSGEIAGLIGVLIDITDKKTAEKALAESEARLKKAQSVAKIGNWEYDISTGKIWGSEQAFRIYGIEREGPYLPLDRVEACIDDAPRVHQALIDLMEKGKPYDIEFDIRQESGGNLITIHSMAEIMYKNGAPAKVLGVIQDITAQKKAEKARKDLETQLEHARKMEALGMLAGGVAHDLNNILSGIVTYPDLLLMDLPKDSPLRKPIETIRESGMRASDVVADLLTLARGVTTVKEISNFKILIEEYLNSAEHQKILSLYPSVTFKTEIDSELLNISCSPTHIKKSLMNLVLNASEAIQRCGGGHHIRPKPVSG